MRVLVTGGTGSVGRAVTRLLAEAGYEVTVIGRSARAEVEHATYEQCDVNDYDRLREVVEGHESIVHLAALRSPVGNPGREVFRVNDLGTFHVFEAAAEAGIGRVVAASSINALGTFFGDRSPRIVYLPVDESHPTLATDAYSFSKQVMEEIGRYFSERDGITSTLLRLPAVVSHEKITEGISPYATYDWRIIERLIAMPEGKRIAELQRLQTEYDRFRREHRLEHEEWSSWRNASSGDAVLSRQELLFMHHRANLFTYVDELDSAASIVAALEAPFQGSHALFINAKTNDVGVPAGELAKLYATDTPAIRPSTAGDSTLVSIDRARQLIGFEPEWNLPA
ncbi:MAG: NAD-dependent epimerase/dehydratase family protein [Spirochaetales bacterium]